MVERVTAWTVDRQLNCRWLDCSWTEPRRACMASPSRRRAAAATRLCSFGSDTVLIVYRVLLCAIWWRRLTVNKAIELLMNQLNHRSRSPLLATRDSVFALRRVSMPCCSGSACKFARQLGGAPPAGSSASLGSGQVPDRMTCGACGVVVGTVMLRLAVRGAPRVHLGLDRAKPVDGCFVQLVPRRMPGASAS